MKATKSQRDQAQELFRKLKRDEKDQILVLASGQVGPHREEVKGIKVLHAFESEPVVFIIMEDYGEIPWIAATTYRGKYSTEYHFAKKLAKLLGIEFTYIYKNETIIHQGFISEGDI